MIVAMAELSTNPVDVIRRSLRPPKPVPPAVAAGLAALIPLQERYAELEREELAIFDRILAAGGNWAQIAAVLDIGSRQAARQHGQRLRARVEQRAATAHQVPAAAPAPAPDTPPRADAGTRATPATQAERHQPKRTSRRRRRR
jgi:hypothetical protein